MSVYFHPSAFSRFQSLNPEFGIHCSALIALAKLEPKVEVLDTSVSIDVSPEKLPFAYAAEVLCRGFPHFAKQGLYLIRSECGACQAEFCTQFAFVGQTIQTSVDGSAYGAAFHIYLQFVEHHLGYTAVVLSVQGQACVGNVLHCRDKIGDGASVHTGLPDISSYDHVFKEVPVGSFPAGHIQVQVQLRMSVT